MGSSSAPLGENRIREVGLETGFDRDGVDDRADRVGFGVDETRPDHEGVGPLAHLVGAGDGAFVERLAGVPIYQQIRRLAGDDLVDRIGHERPNVIGAGSKRRASDERGLIWVRGASPTTPTRPFSRPDSSATFESVRWSRAIRFVGTALGYAFATRTPAYPQLRRPLLSVVSSTASLFSMGHETHARSVECKQLPKRLSIYMKCVKAGC